MSARHERPEGIQRILFRLQAASAFAAALVLGSLVLHQWFENTRLRRVEEYHLRSRALCDQMALEAGTIESFVLDSDRAKPASTAASAAETATLFRWKASIGSAAHLLGEALDELEALQERFGGEDFEATLLRLSRAARPLLIDPNRALRRDSIEPLHVASVLVASKQLALLHEIAGQEHLKRGERLEGELVVIGAVVVGPYLVLAVLYSRRLRDAVRTLFLKEQLAREALEENRRRLEELIAIRAAEYEEVRLSRELHRSLASLLDSMREDEREGVARELHDELGQPLAGAGLDFAWLLNKLDPGDPKDSVIAERLRAIKNVLDRSLAHVKGLTWRLRPPLLDDLGLAAAIDWQVGELERQSGRDIECVIEAEGLAPEKNRDVGIFRILQDALTSLAHPTVPERLSVSFRQERDELLLEVGDNETGMPNRTALSDDNSLLRLNMTRRAESLGGEVEFLESEKGGSVIRLRIPCPDLCSV